MHTCTLPCPCVSACAFTVVGHLTDLCMTEANTDRYKKSEGKDCYQELQAGVHMCVCGDR